MHEKNEGICHVCRPYVCSLEQVDVCMFKEVSNKISFPEMEQQILQFWQEEDVFEKSLALRKDAEHYVFYDGPPFATGLPHYGHLLAGTIKDIIPRYQTMRGHCVERRFGWDCHGLPIEALAQEALGLAGSAAIKERGVDVFNEQCRSMVLQYVEEWRKTVTRMGRWVDFDNGYKTMDTSFMETIWWVFRQLWDQGRIYRSYRIMPYSWKLTTPLSNFEAGSNYKQVQDPAITVRVKLQGMDIEGPYGDVYALLWTTTPWTLPGNLAICAGPDIDYRALYDKCDKSVYIMASARVEAYYKDPDQYDVVRCFKGRDLEGCTYEPLFSYYRDTVKAFTVLTDAFVSTEDGTGIVHLAPAYGEDDFRVCSSHGIMLVDPLDDNCQFTPPVVEYEGQFCKDADKAIIRRLKDEGKLVHHATVEHSYPFCERTDTPIIYRAIDAWYVRVEDLRQELSENNATVHWMPDYVGEKRFGNWLKDAKDWNISRNRYWGSCIPVWINEQDPDDMICVGSIDELEKLSGHRVDDLHKHILDDIVIEKGTARYRRTPEVLDCWFESGSMPYAQQHYPFENSKHVESFFPADFIAEGLDQTRGWFYTLLILSTALFKKSCYRNVIVNGLVLAEDGRKMSKRLKNYPDPTYMLDAYGADALRLYLIHSPVVKAEDLCFTEDGVKHALRHLMIPWWNAYSFFITYARVDGWRPSAAECDSDHVLDQWIMSSLDRLFEEVVEAMDSYNLQKAIRPFVRFIEDLTNWYIRRSRRRFWKSSDDVDKKQAYKTLYTVLLELSKVAAPFVPFISESIYRNLRTEDMPLSVHLCDFPHSQKQYRNQQLEEQMGDVMKVVGMGRQLRSEYTIKVRQPLQGLHVVCRDSERLSLIESMADIISDELNVRHVWISEDESGLAVLKAKANFRHLGPRWGGKVKDVATIIGRLPAADMEQLLNGNKIQIEVGGQPTELFPEDVVIERIPKEGVAVLSEGSLVVAIETNLTRELVREGLAREFINKVQNMRKDESYDVTQRITVHYGADDELSEAIEEHADYIQNEVLALGLKRVSDVTVHDAEEKDINGMVCRIAIFPIKK